jgi:hypothetical protein
MRFAVLPLFLLATPALAETDIRQLVIDTASANGCQLSDALAEATFPAMGLTKDDVGPVVEEMSAAGEVEVIDKVLHLSADLCTGDAAAPVEAMAPDVSATMAQVIAVFQAHGCTMTEDEGMPALEAAGLTEETLDGINDESEALMEAGLMVMDEAALTITFTEPLCTAGDAAEATEADAGADAGAEAGTDPADALIRMLSENGCALTQEAAWALMADYEVTELELDEMADSLMDRGLARVEGEELILEGCGG